MKKIEILAEEGIKGFRIEKWIEVSVSGFISGPVVRVLYLESRFRKNVGDLTDDELLKIESIAGSSRISLKNVFVLTDDSKKGHVVSEREINDDR